MRPDRVDQRESLVGGGEQLPRTRSRCPSPPARTRSAAQEGAIPRSLRVHRRPLAVRPCGAHTPTGDVAFGAPWCVAGAPAPEGRGRGRASSEGRCTALPPRTTSPPPRPSSECGRKTMTTARTCSVGTTCAPAALRSNPPEMARPIAVSCGALLVPGSGARASSRGPAVRSRRAWSGAHRRQVVAKLHHRGARRGPGRRAAGRHQLARSARRAGGRARSTSDAGRRGGGRRVRAGRTGHVRAQRVDRTEAQPAERFGASGGSASSSPGTAFVIGANARRAVARIPVL